MPGSATLGAIYVDYRARNAEFLRRSQQTQRQLRQVRGSMRRLQRRSQALTQTLTRLGVALAGGIGVTAAVVAFSRLGRTAGEYGARLVEVSAAVGTTVDDLQLLRRVLLANGVAIEQSDKAFVRLNRAFAEAEFLETYARAFRAIGVDVEALRASGAGLPQVLSAVANGFQRTGDSARIAYAAQQLFGRQGAFIANSLRAGGDELERQIELQREFGALTQEQAVRLKALSQTYADTAEAVQVASSQLAADNAELYASVNRLVGSAKVGGLRLLVEETERVIRQYTLLAGLTDIFEGAVRRTQTTIRGGIPVETTALDFGRIAENVRAAYDRAADPDLLADLFGELDTDASTLAFGDVEATQQITAALERQLVLAENLRTQSDGIAQSLHDRIDALRIEQQLAAEQVSGDGLSRRREQLEAISELVRTERDRRLEVEVIERRIATARQIVIEAQAAQDVVAEERAAKLIEAQERQLVLAEQQLVVARDRLAAQDQYVDALRRVQAEEAALEEASRSAAARVERLTSVATGIGDAFGAFAGDAIRGFDDIGRAAEALARRILDSLIEVLVVRQISNAVSGALLGGVPTFAEGGLARQGLAVVGERGPELVDFRAPGRVYSAEDLRAAVGGAGGVSVTYAPVIQSTDSDQVRRVLLESYPHFEQSVRAGLARDARRPSTFRRAIRG